MEFGVKYSVLFTEKTFFAELNSLCVPPRIERVAVRRESVWTAWTAWTALIQSRTKILHTLHKGGQNKAIPVQQAM